jgi:hypothetical protein
MKGATCSWGPSLLVEETMHIQIQTERCMSGSATQAYSMTVEEMSPDSMSSVPDVGAS